ncbi:MAG: ABC transporter permease, partial [Gracilimonas sp.]
KVYSSINIFGLAIGLATCIIILLYVTHELSYDKHHKQSERIYRVTSHIDFSGSYLQMASVPAPMGPTLKSDFPEIEAVARLRPLGSLLVNIDQQNFREEGFVYADSSVFNVFTIPLIHGQPQTALSRPNTIAISKKTALKYFGTTDVIGQSLTIQNDIELEVTGVFEDMPATSHFHFNFLLSMASNDEADNNMWMSNNFRTYLLLKKGVSPDEFRENFEIIKKTYIEPQVQQFLGTTIAEFEAAGNRLEYRLQPLESIHLYSSLNGEFEPNGSISYVYIFSGLAIFILLLACINFMNLSTARSSQRAKEVGIRKSLGSDRSKLAIQFLLESLILSYIALFISLFIVELTLPFFSELAGRSITTDYFTNLPITLIIIGIVTITGLLAGSYPAAMLSSFQPVKVLKGTFFERKGHGRFRKGLVVFQFSISIVIIVGLLVINDQLQFIQNTNIGFEKEQVVIVEGAYAIGSSSGIQAFKDDILKQSYIESATVSSYFPVEGYGRNDMAYWPKGESPSQDNTVSIQQWEVDENYIETLNIEILKGRNFSEQRSTDNQTVILNEAAVKQFGFENPIGKSITSYAMDHENNSIDQNQTVSYEIVGVMKNFHHESLRKNITPLALFNRPSSGNVAFKFSTENTRDMIAAIENEWNSLAPGQPFNYAFLDQRFDQMYRAETRIQNLVSTFSILAILIACLGLFGLSAYSAEKRSKEIGIRKILGASISSLLRLMSKEFLALIAISFAISIPVATIIMEQWLQEFTYRTEIGLSVFVLAGLGTMLIAL